MCAELLTAEVGYLGCWCHESLTIEAQPVVQHAAENEEQHRESYLSKILIHVAIYAVSYSWMDNMIKGAVLALVA